MMFALPLIARLAAVTTDSNFQGTLDAMSQSVHLTSPFKCWQVSGQRVQ